MTQSGLAPTQSPWNRWHVWLAAALPMLIYACILASKSDGVYHDDDLMHYLMARWAWHDPVFLLHDWGRPGFTVPYAAFAWIGDYAQGMQACRYVTLALAAASAVLACATANALRVRHAWIAGIALLAMPLYFRLSFATLTETICGFYLIAGTYLLTRGHLKSAAMLLALAPLTRHEAVVFLVPVAVYFLMQRKWAGFLLLAWAEVLWNLLSIKWYWMLPIKRYLQAKPIESYGHGGGLHYFLMWGHVSTPVLLAMSLAGAGLVFWPIVRRIATGETAAAEAVGSPCSTPLGEQDTEPSRDADWRGIFSRLVSLSPRDAGALLVVVGVIGMVALQTVLYYRNTFASGGYARFLVPAGPWMAVLAAVTMDRFLGGLIPFGKPRRCDRSGAIRFAGGAMAIGLALVWLASRCELPQQSEWMIRSLYQGWAGHFIDRYTWWLVAAGVLVAFWPRRRTSVVVLALVIWWVGGVWWKTSERLFITPGERLIKQGIDAAQNRADERGVKLAIRGQSPWVDFYLERKGSASDPTPLEWWTAGKEEESRMLLLDNDYTPGDKREKIYATPHEQVFFKTLKEAYPEAYQYWYSVEVLERR